MDEGLSCPICLIRFNDTSRAPLLLMCGHTFCRMCLNLLQKAKNQLKCPHCNKLDSRPTDSLPKNYILSDILMKQVYTTPNSQTDPWACKLHPGESIAFMSQSTRQLFCSECLIGRNINDLMFLESNSIGNHLKRFQEMFQNISVGQFVTRAEICGQLSQAMQGHKLRVVQQIDSNYMNTIQALQNQYNAFKQKITAGFNKEREKLNDVKDLMNILKEMKTIGVPLSQAESKLSVPKQLQLIGSLISLDELGDAAELKKLSQSPLEFQNNISVPSRFFDVAIAITETPSLLIKGMGTNSSEQKLSRFGTPSNRWGLFEGRNQVQAVTFCTNQDLFITALGIGNSYQVTKPVKLETLRILDGQTTDSPILSQVSEVDIVQEEGGPKIFKVELPGPVSIISGKEYTIRLILTGEAGVYRGGSTSRTKTVENGLTFKFKSATYASSDVKNGENADDGPIFDIYYKMNLGNNSSEVVMKRFKQITPNWSFVDEQLENLSFSVNKPVELAKIWLGAPMEQGQILVLEYLKIVRGISIEGPEIFSGLQKTQIQYSATKMHQIEIPDLIKLEPGDKYTLFMGIKGTAKAFGGSELAQLPFQSSGLVVNIQPTETSPGQQKPNQHSGPIIQIGFKLGDTSAFAMGDVPERLSELSGGEIRLQRFQQTEKQWHLNSENQVQAFSFTFNQDVLLTAVGVGNCAKVGSFITVQLLQIIIGQSTVGSLVYSSIQNVSLYNHTDTNPIVKLPLQHPVRLSGNMPYTIRAIIRGEGKSFKGKKFKGGIITQPDGIIFTSNKCRMGGSDKRNGDNQSSGPLFDFYYIAIQQIYSIKEFNDVQKILFPLMEQQKKEFPTVYGEEFSVCRYSSTGSSWHVNSDGKQTEAISFKASKTIQLSAIGVGNAYEQGKKVSIKKIQIRQGKSTKAAKIYSHTSKEKLINIGEQSKFVRIALQSPLTITAQTWYTLRLKYKPGSPVCRGKDAQNAPLMQNVQFTFEKAKFDGGDVENGSHELHGPLRDFYFFL